MEQDSAETLLDHLTSQLSLIGEEAAFLLEQKERQNTEVRALEGEVSALKNQLMFVTTASLAGEGTEIQDALQQAEERLDGEICRRLQGLREVTKIEVGSREQALLREAIRNTKDEGQRLLTRLQVLEQRRGATGRGLPNTPCKHLENIENTSLRHQHLKQQHLEVVRLAKEHESSLLRCFAELEDSSNMKVSATAALQDVKKEVLNDLTKDDDFFGDGDQANYMPESTVDSEAMKKSLQEVYEDCREKSKLVVETLNSITEILTCDKEFVLLREELPSRLMVRERELERFREEVERDRRELLVRHQLEKLNLNIVQADLNSKLEKIRSQQIERSVQVQEKYLTLGSEEIVKDKILESEEAEILWLPSSHQILQPVGKCGHKFSFTVHVFTNILSCYRDIVAK